jgi:hypothetical protein
VGYFESTIRHNRRSISTAPAMPNAAARMNPPTATKVPAITFRSSRRRRTLPTITAARPANHNAEPNKDETRISMARLPTDFIHAALSAVRCSSDSQRLTRLPRDVSTSHSRNAEPHRHAHGARKNGQQSRQISERKSKQAAIAFSERLADYANRPRTRAKKKPPVPWEFGDVGRTEMHGADFTLPERLLQGRSEFRFNTGFLMADS